ncbi:MAG: peroxiredoxin family protein, partial [Pirellulaceae bacterium]
MIATLALLAAGVLSADSIETTFVAEGVTRQVGGYSPVRAQLSEERGDIQKLPDGLASPRFAKIRFGDLAWSLALDEPADGPARLFVDSNHDGDLTNDPAIEWTSRDVGTLKTHHGSTTIELEHPQAGRINIYRFDPNDPLRKSLKDTVLYYADFGYKVTLKLDGQEHVTFAAGSLDTLRRMWVDRDQNGQRSYKRETVVVGTPFNFTGTTYTLVARDGKLNLEKAATPVPLMPLPPNLARGQKVLPFEAETLAGDKIKFPDAFRGKIVLLDFWATWCGPCIGEIPNVKQAYEDSHEKGFEVLGISFDNAGAVEKVKAFLTEHELPWPQIYEGKGWGTTIGEQY